MDGFIAKMERSGGEEVENSERAVVRTLVELRESVASIGLRNIFRRVSYSDVDALKKEYGEGSGYECEIRASVLIREPTSQTLSFYEYYIRKQQEPDPWEKKTVTLVGSWEGKLGATSAVVSSGRATNGQVREILGIRCTTNLREPGYETGGGDETDKAGEDALDRSRKSVKFPAITNGSSDSPMVR